MSEIINTVEIIITDSQGNELQIGDKVLVVDNKCFIQRIVSDIKPNSSFPYHSKVGISPEDGSYTRYTYAYRLLKYNW